MAVTVRAVRASNGARDWPRQVAGQADHLQPCGGRGRLIGGRRRRGALEAQIQSGRKRVKALMEILKCGTGRIR